jgi:hypothetical protein
MSEMSEMSEAEHVLRQEGGVGMEGAEEGGNTVRSMI